jgi:hypothetical protein
MLRPSKWWLPVTALLFALWIPARSSAEPISSCGADGASDYGYYRGSYSCLHYWVPRLYMFRAYHRDTSLNDSTPYDQFPPSRPWSRHSCSGAPAIPAPSPENKNNNSE